MSAIAKSTENHTEAVRNKCQRDYLLGVIEGLIEYADDCDDRNVSDNQKIPDWLVMKLEDVIARLEAGEFDEP